MNEVPKRFDIIRKAPFTARCQTTETNHHQSRYRAACLLFTILSGHNHFISSILFRMKEEELDALPWIDGPKSAGIRGFCFKDKEDPQRYQEMYSSIHEKLWCEASGLIRAELWDEAEEKMKELRKYLGHCDMELEAKLSYGIAMRGVGSATASEAPVGIIDEHQFEMARQTLRFEINLDEGCDIDTLSKRLCNLVEARIRAVVPLKNYRNHPDDDEPYYWVLDYEQASTQALVHAADLWLEVPKAATSVCSNPTDYTDIPHEATHCIVEELAKRGEYKKALKVAREILEVDPSMSGYIGPGIFWAAIAECSEALGETAIAHESYVKLEKYDYCGGQFYDREKNERDSLFCMNVKKGKLKSRINRTRSNVSRQPVWPAYPAISFSSGTCALNKLSTGSVW